MNSILNQTKQKISKNILISNDKDVFYLTRFKSSNFKLLLINGIWYGLTDSRYINNAKATLSEIEIIDMTEKGWLDKILETNKFDELWVSSKDTTLQSFDNMKNSFGAKGIELKHFDYGNIRSAYNKDDEMILRESTRLNEVVMDWITKEIKVGMTEKQVAAMIINKINEVGADGLSFDPIVAFGGSGANPHWEPSGNVLKANEMITLDIGLFYKGFASDMTRTFVIEGKVSEEEEKIWSVVKETVEESIKNIKPGASVKELHQKSIDIIDSYGYKDYFNHSLGHGLGVEVHDYPNISIYSNAVLEKGMVITIEPGIYIPGKYGVRIEQNALVTEDGFEVLNNTPIELYI